MHKQIKKVCEMDGAVTAAAEMKYPVYVTSEQGMQGEMVRNPFELREALHGGDIFIQGKDAPFAYIIKK